MSIVLIVGASGTIGRATVTAFEDFGDEVITASRHTTPSLDLSDTTSIDAFFAATGPVDAIVSTTGTAPFTATADATTDDFIAGIRGKLLSQIGLSLHGLPHLRDGGSITLVSGILTQHPVRDSVVAGTVNGGVEAFVTSAATDLPRGIRINAVSPNVVRESWDSYGPSFPGSIPVDAATVAAAYVRSVHGVATGQVLRVW